MPRWLLLILGVLILYLLPSLTLKVVYGRSYRMTPCENCWVPDDHGGWQAKGYPDTFRPTIPSEDVPIFLELAPYVLPLLLIILFLLSPLSQFVEREPEFNPNSYESEKYEARFVEIDANDKTEIG
jgi:hypothetical protein